MFSISGRPAASQYAAIRTMYASLFLFIFLFLFLFIFLFLFLFLSLSLSLSLVGLSQPRARTYERVVDGGGTIIINTWLFKHLLNIN